MHAFVFTRCYSPCQVQHDSVQVTSDLPPHQHLKGQDCANGQRTFDNGTRGLGGNIGCPTCSVGEQVIS